MTIKKKIITTLWFISKPRYWVQYFQLIKRKIFALKDSDSEKEKAISWAKQNAIEYSYAWKKIGLEGETAEFDEKILNEARQLANNYKGLMGGPGHINFIYNAVKLLNAKYVVETGVAYGWSSLAILAGFFENKNDGKLFSVDMPYPNRNNEPYVGIVVPKRFQKNWKIIDRPDITGIPLALRLVQNKIDLCHYDSDKSRVGRAISYPILWNSLRSGGLFISDDVGDNLFFSEFAKSVNASYCVIKVQGNQYMGAIRKP